MAAISDWQVDPDAAFDAIDSNGDGVIDRTEFRAADLAGVDFETFDGNQDGVITRSEFCAVALKSREGTPRSGDLKIPAQEAPVQEDLQDTAQEEKDVDDSTAFEESSAGESQLKNGEAAYLQSPAQEADEEAAELLRKSEEPLRRTADATDPAQAEEPAASGIFQPQFVKAEEPAASGIFQPQFVKVKDGMAHIVTRYQEVYLYIEAEVTGAGRSVKVWVLDKSQSLRSILEARVSPVHNKLTALTSDGKARVLSMTEPILATVTDGVLRVKGNVGGIAADGKAKMLAITEPIYVSVTDGVLHVKGTIDGARLYMEIKASETWTACNARALAAYTSASESLERIVQPVKARSGKAYIAMKDTTLSIAQPLYSRCTAVKDKTLSIAQPYYVRTKDGVLYVRIAVGDALVNVKMRVCEKTDLLKLAALTAYTRACTTVAPYMSPVVSKIVAIYDNLSTRLLTAFGPYLDKLHQGVSYGRAKVYDVPVAIKVMTKDAYERATGLPASCYVTIKDGFAYVRGNLGNKAVLIKVQLSALTDRTKEVLDMAKIKILDARDQTRLRMLALGTSAKSVAGQKNNQVTAASAAGGAIAMGATGAAAGAACGLPLALFTFGLSIPIGAAIGGSAGFCAGGAVGGAVGHKVCAKKGCIADGSTTDKSEAARVPM